MTPTADRRGCMSAPGQVCAQLTGPQVARLADIVDETGSTIDDTVTRLLVAAIDQEWGCADRPTLRAVEG